MSKQQNGHVITLADLWGIFTNHIGLIVLSAILCTACAFIYSKVMVTPEYRSTSTLYILKQDNSADYAYTQSDFTLALNIVNDCTYMIKSSEVLIEAIDELDLDMSPGYLANLISVTNPDNTRVLEVSVCTADAAQSKKIVDSICKFAAKKINETMNADQVNVYAKGTLENTPCNGAGVMYYAVVAAIAMVAVYVIFLVNFLLDDKIRTAEDVEKYLGLSVLGDIPNSKGTRRNNKYSRYNRYDSDGYRSKTRAKKKSSEQSKEELRED